MQIRERLHALADEMRRSCGNPPTLHGDPVVWGLRESSDFWANRLSEILASDDDLTPAQAQAIANDAGVRVRTIEGITYTSASSPIHDYEAEQERQQEDEITLCRWAPAPPQEHT